MTTSLQKTFGNIYESLNNSKHAFESLDSSSAVTKSYGAIPQGPQEEYLLQRKIRPLFGKEGINRNPIGTHPDFLALESHSETVYQYTCTLFIDIKGSTRLSLIYQLDEVYKFKNAVIQTCVEVIRALDGHVHRIMGDAVMAFFGGSQTHKEDAIADTVNCCITLRAILEESIKPWMESNGFEAKDFGFRIGCDFGDDEEVLWGGFGYSNVGEVSATGLPVDMASKLQGLANKNQTMLGEGLLSFVNWPEKYTSIKQVMNNGEYEPSTFVIPNLTNSKGLPINYSMRLLDYRACLEFCALPRSFKANIKGSQVIENPLIDFNCFIDDSDKKRKYISASYFLEKQKDIYFKVTVNTRGRISFPLTAYFSKTNHGEEAPQEERGVEQVPVTRKIIKKRNGPYDKSTPLYSITSIRESTQYRGLHTMKCEVRDSYNQIIFRDWIGVMIK